MEFCDVCGAMMQPRKVGNKKQWVCPVCGAVKDAEAGSEESLSFEIKHNDPEKGKMLILKDEKAIRTRPAKLMYCPKCKKEVMVEYWELQTRSADEAPTRFFKCENGHTWREYD